MTKLAAHFLIVILSFTSIHAHALTVLVSDIDDTLKVSHVLDTWDSIWNGPKVRNEFYGMAGLINELSTITSETPKYLTNAPVAMEALHKRFIEVNKFTKGDLLIRRGSADTHKLSALRKLRDTLKPNKFILIGDNGERDILFYETFAKETPDTQILTYIRYAYSPQNRDETGKPVRPGQVGFVTTIDLALSLYESGELSLGSTDKVVRAFLPRFLTARFDEEPIEEEGGPIAYPKWMDCRGFKWTAKPEWLEQWPDLAKLEVKLGERCKAAPKRDEWRALEQVNL